MSEDRNSYYVDLAATETEIKSIVADLAEIIREKSNDDKYIGIEFKENGQAVAKLVPKGKPEYITDLDENEIPTGDGESWLKASQWYAFQDNKIAGATAPQHEGGQRSVSFRISMPDKGESVTLTSIKVKTNESEEGKEYLTSDNFNKLVAKANENTYNEDRGEDDGVGVSTAGAPLQFSTDTSVFKTTSGSNVTYTVNSDYAISFSTNGESDSKSGSLTFSSTQSSNYSSPRFFFLTFTHNEGKTFTVTINQQGHAHIEIIDGRNTVTASRDSTITFSNKDPYAKIQKIGATGDYDNLVLTTNPLEDEHKPEASLSLSQNPKVYFSGTNLTSLDGTTRFTMHDNAKFDMSGGINRPDAGPEVYLHGNSFVAIHDDAVFVEKDTPIKIVFTLFCNSQSLNSSTIKNKFTGYCPECNKPKDGLKDIPPNCQLHEYTKDEIKNLLILFLQNNTISSWWNRSTISVTLNSQTYTLERDKIDQIKQDFHLNFDLQDFILKEAKIEETSESYYSSTTFSAYKFIIEATENTTENLSIPFYNLATLYSKNNESKNWKPTLDIHGSPYINIGDTPIITFSESSTFHVQGNTDIIFEGRSLLHTMGSAEIIFEESAIVHVKDEAMVNIQGQAKIEIGGSYSTQGTNRVDGGETLCYIKDDTQIFIDGDAKSKCSPRIKLHGPVDLDISCKYKKDIPTGQQATYMGIVIHDTPYIMIEGHSIIKMSDNSNICMTGPSKLIMNGGYNSNQNGGMIFIDPDSIKISGNGGKSERGNSTRVQDYAKDSQNQYFTRDYGKNCTENPRDPRLKIDGDSLIIIDDGGNGYSKNGHNFIQISADRDTETEESWNEIMIHNSSFIHHSGHSHEEMHDNSQFIMKGKLKDGVKPWTDGALYGNKQEWTRPTQIKEGSPLLSLSDEAGFVMRGSYDSYIKKGEEIATVAEGETKEPPEWWDAHVKKKPGSPLVEVIDDVELRLGGSLKIESKTDNGTTTITICDSKNGKEDPKADSEQCVSFTIADLYKLKQLIQQKEVTVPAATANNPPPEVDEEAKKNQDNNEENE